MNIYGAGILIVSLLFVFLIVWVRNAPKQEAEKIRAVFRRINERFTEKGMPLTITESGTALIHAQDWEIRAVTDKLDWGLKVLFISSLRGECRIGVDFQLSATNSALNQKEAEQIVHNMITPLVTGTVSKQTVILGFIPMVDVQEFSTPEKVDVFARSIISMVRKYFLCRRGGQAEFYRLAVLLAQLEAEKRYLEQNATHQLIALNTAVALTPHRTP